MDLPDDPQAVGLVAGEDVGVGGEGGAELGEVDGVSGADQHHAAAEHVESAALVKLVADAVLVSDSQVFGWVVWTQARTSAGKRARARS